MPAERTLSIIKPDATGRNLTGSINAKFEEAGTAKSSPRSGSGSAARKRRPSMPFTGGGLSLTSSANS